MTVTMVLGKRSSSPSNGKHLAQKKWYISDILLNNVSNLREATQCATQGSGLLLSAVLKQTDRGIWWRILPLDADIDEVSSGKTFYNHPTI